MPVAGETLTDGPELPLMAKRRTWTHRERSVAFAPATTEPGALPEARTVYMVGRWVTPGNTRAWLGDTPGEVYEAGHYPVVRIDDGPTVMDSAQWFGVHEVEPETVERWWWWLTDAVRHAWRRNDPGALNGSPGTVGRDLWLRTIPAGKSYPVLPAEQQQSIRSMAGQGRIESFGGGGLADGIRAVDMRLAYAACLDGLPVGEPERRGGGWWSADRQQRCKVFATVRVPREWRHVGMLPVRADGGRWVWPAEPGRVLPHEWYDGAELELAVRHGWEVVESHETIVWPETDRPFRLWVGRLLSIIETAPAEMRRPIRFACRAMILHTIGAIHGAPYRVSHTTAPEVVPATAHVIGATGGGAVRWVEHKPPAWPETAHPEWSSHIWARARRRLLQSPGGGGLLAMDRARLIGVRTDAIYYAGTGEPWPGYVEPESPKPGAWIRAHDDPRSQPWPRTNAELMRATGVLS